MKIAKKHLLVMVLGISFYSAEAQLAPIKRKGGSIDFGLMIGGSNYLGELTKGIFPVWAETNLAGGVLFRYNLGESFTLKGSALYGRIEGTDKNFESDNARKQRNLSFRSDIVEFSGQIEWNIFGFISSRNTLANTPFLFTGLSVYRFNPKALFKFVPGVHDDPVLYTNANLSSQDNKWIELQPLNTEGQETTKFNDKKRYALTQLSIPIGLGWKWQIDDAWTLGFEAGVRKTFTDYLDDISTIYVNDQIIQGSSGYMGIALKDRSAEAGFARFEDNVSRGNNKNKDWYMFAGITITYRIRGGGDKCPQM